MAEIFPGVHQTDGVNANAYLVVEEDGALTLIDTGMSRDVKKILNYIETKMSKKPSDVKTIILTHCHIDHVRGAYEMKKATGARVAIHELDADYLSGKKRMPFPRGATGVLFRIFAPFFKFTPVEPDLRLKENDLIGDGRFAVIHTPGHTPGSISLYDKERKLVFVGDTIRYIKGKLQGPPKAFTPDMREAVRSVRKISNLDFDAMLGGHGDPLKSNGTQRVRELAESLG